MEQLASALVARFRDEHVPWPSGEEVGDVEPARATQHRRDPLVEQDSLDHLAVRETACTGHPHQLAPRELRADLPRPLMGIGDRLRLASPGIDERHPAVPAESLAERM